MSLWTPTCMLASPTDVQAGRVRAASRACPGPPSMHGRACSGPIEEQHFAAKLLEPSAVFVRNPEQTRERWRSSTSVTSSAPESPLRREALGHRRKARISSTKALVPRARPSARAVGSVRSHSSVTRGRGAANATSARVDQVCVPGSPLKDCDLLTKEAEGAHRGRRRPLRRYHFSGARGRVAHADYRAGGRFAIALLRLSRIFAAGGRVRKRDGWVYIAGEICGRC